MKLTKAPILTLTLTAATALLTACASKPLPPESPLVTYACDGAIPTIMADYYNAPKTPYVILGIGDTKHTLKLGVSASGARYTDARHTPAKNGSLVWWTKGYEGMLYEVTARTNGSAYERQLATCTSKPQPLNARPQTLPQVKPTKALPGTIPGTVPGGYYAPQSSSPAPTATI